VSPSRRKASGDFLLDHFIRFGNDLTDGLGGGPARGIQEIVPVFEYQGPEEESRSIRSHSSALCERERDQPGGPIRR